MRIPNADRAIVDIRKLRDYSLNPLHGTGKHKARVFAAALGMTADDAEALREILLKAVRECDAELTKIAGNIHSVRITLGYRAVGVLDDDEIVWFWAGAHSDYDTLIARLR